MPTYEYECDACEHRFEIVQGIDEQRLIVCPECNAPALNRLISGGLGFIMSKPAHINVPANNASESRKKRHAEDMIKLTSEPMSESEKQVAQAQATERDEAHGFKQGHGWGDRKPIVGADERQNMTKQQVRKKVSDARSDGQKRIAASQEMRKKSI